jgi:hypothetical protein
MGIGIGLLHTPHAVAEARVGLKKNVQLDTARPVRRLEERVLENTRCSIGRSQSAHPSANSCHCIALGFFESALLVRFAFLGPRVQSAPPL